MNTPLQNRIAYQGDLTPLLEQVVADFELGNYVIHQIVTVGSEDFNVLLTTNKDKYFLKIFAAFRDEAACGRYVYVTLKALEIGINHPKLFSSSQGYLHHLSLNGIDVRLVVMEYIEGQTFYDLGETPTQNELCFLVQQAALINSKMDIHPLPIYDSMAIINLIKEFTEKKKYLEQSDFAMIQPVVDSFAQLNLASLPHCFVHGDIGKANIIRSNSGELYIIDFSVSNFYPRIQELASMICNLLFDEKHTRSFGNNCKLCLSEYQKVLPLTKHELAMLPLFIKAAHCLHILYPLYLQKAKNNQEKEIAQWLEQGRAGLKLALNFWKE